MSVRAYFIKDINKCETESFGFWHDEDFVDLLDLHCCQVYEQLNDDNLGQFEIYCEDWEEFKRWWNEEGKAEFPDWRRKGFKGKNLTDADIEEKIRQIDGAIAQVNIDFVKAKMTSCEDYVRYYCY